MKDRKEEIAKFHLVPEDWLKLQHQIAKTMGEKGGLGALFDDGQIVLLDEIQKQFPATSLPKQEDGWISCKDRLPKCDEQHGLNFSSGRILVYGQDGVSIGEYLTQFKDEGMLKKVKEYWMDNDDITHWMPLPNNPPKQ